MTNLKRTVLLTGLALVVAGAAGTYWTPLEAGAGSFVLVQGIIETPDPIECNAFDEDVPWSDANGDGVIDFGDEIVVPAYDTGLGTEVLAAVWASGTAADHDVSFSERIGGLWSDESLVAATPADEIDPAIDVSADGVINVAWWESDAPHAVLATRRDPMTGIWARSVVVATDGGRPTIVARGAQRFVGFERHDSASTRQVVVVVEAPGGRFDSTKIAQTGYQGPLDITLHTAGARIWVEWQHTAVLRGVSEYVNGRWIAPKTQPWNGLPWAGNDQVVSLACLDCM